MILQQLVQDAERIVGDMPPPMYGPTPIKWIIDLDAEGKLIGCIPTTGSDNPKKDKGLVRPAPILSRKRTSGVAAVLLVDKPSYVFGIPADDKRATEKTDAFRKLIAECAAATGNPTLTAVTAFLAWWDSGERTLSRLYQQEVGDGDLFTFRVAGRLPIDDADVRQFWADKSYAADDGASGALAQCLLCGRQTVIPKCLPVPIKGLIGGQSSGIPLVSINADAFESYGLKDGATSGVCMDCGERFGKALNHLLAADDSHLGVGPIAYAFWTRQGGGFAWATMLKQPQPDTVKQLLSSYKSGKEFTAFDQDDFYATALTASGGRAVIRDWLHTTVGTASAQLAHWFARLQQVDEYGQPGKPLGVFLLARSLYRDPKDIEAPVPKALVQAALHGTLLPAWLLTKAVHRSRVEKTVTYPRAALLKTILISQGIWKEDSMTQLEPEETKPGYLCGRLLAVLEEVQRASAEGNLNTTLVDRFYGAASTSPASVFGNLLSDAQPHLAKLRKKRPGTHMALQMRLEEVLLNLTGFPRTLSMQDQALFSLGYYHQRAHDRAAMQARKAAGNADLTTIIEHEEDDHE